MVTTVVVVRRWWVVDGADVNTHTDSMYESLGMMPISYPTLVD